MVMIGYFMLLRKRKSTSSSESGALTVKSTAPLLTALISSLVARYTLGQLFMPIGVALGLAAMAAYGGPRSVATSARSRRVYRIAFASLAAIYMRRCIETAGLLDIFNGFPQTPLTSTAILSISFILGLTAGSPTVAMTVGYSLSRIPQASWLTLGGVYTASFLGYTASPAHLCLIYTAEYFNTPLFKPHKKLVALSLACVIVNAIALLLMESTWPLS